MTRSVENNYNKNSVNEKLRLLKVENKRLKEKRARLINEIILYKTILSITKKNKF